MKIIDGSRSTEDTFQKIQNAILRKSCKRFVFHEHNLMLIVMVFWKNYTEKKELSMIFDKFALFLQKLIPIISNPIQTMKLILFQLQFCIFFGESFCPI